VVARYFEMWNTGETSIVAEILAPDWVDHAHPEVVGPRDVERAVRSIRAARPSLHFHIDAVLGDGDLVAVLGRAGSPGRLIWLVRLENGRMAEMWTFHENRAQGDP
jgi:hypothetical protein